MADSNSTVPPRRRPHILVAATGSVATIKLPQIVTALSKHDVSIRVMLTPSATAFLAGQSEEQPHLSTLASIPNVEQVFQDADEWEPPWTRGAPILHIELRRWADLLLVAPLSANSLAKMVNGFGDGLVASVLRAWDTTGIIDGVREGISYRSSLAQSAQYATTADTPPTSQKKPVLVAPAMNTAMWQHPITRKQMDVLRSDWSLAQGGWIEVLEPTQKLLACGDTGSGAMMDWTEIVARVEDVLALSEASGSEQRSATAP